MALFGVSNRVADRRAVTSTCHHHGKLGREFTPALDVERHRAPVGQRVEGRIHLRGAADHLIAPAIVGEGASLEHERKSPLSAGGGNGAGVGGVRVLTQRHALHPSQMLFLEQLVLNDGQGSRRGVHCHAAFRLDGGEGGRVDVLDFHRQHIHLRSQLLDAGTVGQRARHGRTTNLASGRGEPRRVEAGELEPEAVGRQRHHLAQLPAAHHAHANAGRIHGRHRRLLTTRRPLVDQRSFLDRQHGRRS
mmetsp:Transcript_36455/g.117063  ORF Transcript_36455/g.117063 Transcript_36455/m.117063 type:complete len:248 (-) Transcript_36455:121-864(-)